MILDEGDLVPVISLQGDLVSPAGGPGAGHSAVYDVARVRGKADLDTDPGRAPLDLFSPKAGISEAVLTVGELSHNPEGSRGKRGT